MSNIHCCVSNKCTGEVYGKWFLKCKFCKNPVFVECMRKRDALTKDVLMYFELGKFNSSGTYNVITDNKEKVDIFQKAFNIDSPFAITCEVCTGKFHRHFIGNDITSVPSSSMIQDNSNISVNVPQTAARNAQHQSRSSIPTVNENATQVGGSANDIGAIKLSPPVLNQPSQRVDIDFQHSIHVTKFSTSTKVSDIIDFITQKTSLEVNKSFIVRKLIKPKTNMKRISFVSFKISASNADTCDILLNEDLWAPHFTASRFVNKENKQAEHKKPTIKPSANVKPVKKKDLKPPNAHHEMKRSVKHTSHVHSAPVNGVQATSQKVFYTIIITNISNY